MFILSSLYIKETEGMGRGVFTKKKIPAHTTIELSPVLIFPTKEVKDAEKTLLYSYVFEWGENKKKRALGMGYISMYNHSYNSNCIYEMDFVDNKIEIITIKDIEKGEELFINYNAVPDDATLVWFHKK